MKILIVYYSKTGKTKEIAHTMANELANGNEVKLRRIKMKNERNLLATYLLDTKKAIKRKKPEIEVMDYDHKDYDLILLGTPVWSNNPVPAINTYLDKSEFRDKRVALFVTLRMMGGEKTIRILTEEIKKKRGEVVDSIIIKTGLLHRQRMLQTAREFAKKLNI
jgi:flavodoxin